MNQHTCNKMEVLVFRTSLENLKQVQMISSILKNHPLILRWSVDLEDWERVLRIEVTDGDSENEIAESIRALGIDCEDLDT